MASLQRAQKSTTWRAKALGKQQLITETTQAFTDMCTSLFFFWLTVKTLQFSQTLPKSFEIP